MLRLRYKCLEDFKIADIGSIKKIDDDLANPILMTFESSKFLGLQILLLLFISGVSF